MKKIFSLLIIIIMFLPVMVFAKEDKILEIDLNKNFSFSMLSYRDYGAFNFFVSKDKIRRTWTKNGTIFYLESGKKLCDCDGNNNCVLSSDITEKDNFTYMFTNEDKEYIGNGCINSSGGLVLYDQIINDASKCSLLKEYDGIKASFHNQVESDFVVNVYGGEDVNSMPFVIAQAIFYDYFSDKLNAIMKYTISDSNDKVLSKIAFNNYRFYTVLEDFDVDNEYYSNEDIVCILTEEEKEKYNTSFDKVVLNYSGTSYSGNVLSIDMTVNNRIDNEFYDYLSIFLDKKLVKLNASMYFKDKDDQTVYSGVDVTDAMISENMEEMFNGIVLVDDNTTFTYDINNNVMLRRQIPDSYSRLIVNFIQKRENTDIFDNDKKADNIIINPKTYSRIIIISILIMLLVSSLLINKRFAKNK